MLSIINTIVFQAFQLGSKIATNTLFARYMYVAAVPILEVHAHVVQNKMQLSIPDLQQIMILLHHEKTKM